VHGGACCWLLQVAKTMAPAVIYIDEVEKVFVSDKKKAKEFGGHVST
jgi:AAA+ superfamily predicted ATPase